MGTMRILDHPGDTCVAWSLDDPASLAEAEACFARLSAERKIPFVRAAGAPAVEAEQVSRFDPTVEEIVWVRPVQGG